MSAKKVSIVKYSPTSSDYIRMRHCINTGLIKLSISKKADYKDEYHIAKYDDSVTPARISHFLKDFSMPETPANRAIYTEYDAMKKIFEIYKEFYMRNMNITDEKIKEDFVETKAKEVIEKKVKIKKTKKEVNEEKMLNYPHKQIDLLEMIDDCEREKGLR